MKKFIAVILAAAICICSFSLCSYAAGENLYEATPYAYGYVIPESLVVRAEPNSGAERIGGLSKNTTIFILEKVSSDTGYWYKINCNGVAGYVMADKIFYRDEYKILNFCTYSESEINTLLAPLFVPNDEPVKTGYTFMGWSTKKGSDVVEYKPMDSLSLTENTTFYAVWRAPTLPENQTKNVGYNSTVIIDVTADNVPYDCCLKVNDDISLPQEAGCGALSLSVAVSNIQQDCELKISITDKDGNDIGGLESTVLVKVNNGFFGKIASFFRYIFNGFKYPIEYIDFR